MHCDRIKNAEDIALLIRSSYTAAHVPIDFISLPIERIDTIDQQVLNILKCIEEEHMQLLKDQRKLYF